MAAYQAAGAITAPSEPERGFTTPLRPSQSRPRNSNSRANLTSTENGHLVSRSTDLRSSRGGVGGSIGNGASAVRLSRDFTDRNGSGQAVYPGSARAGAAAKKKAKEKERKARERERRIQANAKHFAKLEFEEMERHKREAHHDARRTSSAHHGKGIHHSNGGGGNNSGGGGGGGAGGGSNGGSLDYGHRYGHGHGSVSSDNGEPTPFKYKQLGGAALGGFMVGGPVGAFAGAGAALLWDREMREREKKRAMIEVQERRLKRLSRQSFNQNDAARTTDSAASTPRGNNNTNKGSSGGSGRGDDSNDNSGRGDGRRWTRFRFQGKRPATDLGPSFEVTGAEEQKSSGPAASANETIAQVPYIA